MKKVLFTISAAIMIAVLLAVLGSLIYVICDQISLFSVPEKDIETTVATTAPEETVTTASEYTKEIPLEDGGKDVFRYRYDGTLIEYHKYNVYGGVVLSRYYDESGMLTLTREHHITPAGYRDGYTETDASGNKVRYNQDGSIRFEEKADASVQ